MENTNKNDKVILSDIFNAIKTCQAARGEVEANGIANAFARAAQEDKHCLVLFRNVMQNGKAEKAFVMMRDKNGQAMFPLFTDMTKILPVKEQVEKQEPVEIGVMNLKMLIMMLAAKQMCAGIIVNPFMQNFNAPIGFFAGAISREPISRVTLIEADLTALHTGAIVCPTDETISGEGYLDSQVQQAGAEIFKDAIKNAVQNEKMETADVVAVQGKGELHAGYVLFTKIPEYSEKVELKQILESYLNCMNAAKELGCTSIAFPCTSKAMKGLPIEGVIGASTQAVTAWLANHADYKMDVYFCCETKEEKALYQKFFDGIQK